MRLHVKVFEARGLPQKGRGGAAFVKLRVGKSKRKTRFVRGNKNPVWNEEFVFSVSESEEELVASVMIADDEASGKVKVPLWVASESEDYSLPPTWFPLRKHSTAYKIHNCGEVLLSISLYSSRSNTTSMPYPSPASSSANTSEDTFSDSPSRSSFEKAESGDKIQNREEKHHIKNLTGRLVQRLLNKNRESLTNHSETTVYDQPFPASDHESSFEETSAVPDFEETLSSMQRNHQEYKLPDDLKGGILLDKHYVISPKNLNAILFAPDSQFMKELADLEGTTNMKEGPWVMESGETTYLQRTLTYMKAATKLVKAVMATEVQTYCYAYGNSYAVLRKVSTPDVPCGNCFEVVLLYTITPGKQLPSGEETSHLVISYEIKFIQSTLMKAVIEGGAEKGLRESYNQFAALLALKFKEGSESSEEKNKILASVDRKRKSNWEEALCYFSNFTVISTLFLGVFIMCHVVLSVPRVVQGLEICFLDLPDSFGEVMTSALFVLQAERVCSMILRFVQARLLKVIDCPTFTNEEVPFPMPKDLTKFLAGFQLDFILFPVTSTGSDHGKKKNGDGWSLTVALVEGSNIHSASVTSLSDPFVVLGCNGKTLTSSVQLQSHDPQWNEILEFDAMEEPPSLLDVEVFHFRQPCEKSLSLGHAEINLLKCNPSDLADIWVPLQGELAQTHQSKLHMRIFLDDNKGDQITREYIRRMDKELGEKVNLQNPRRTSTFQRLFRLPPEEFLVNEFSCCLKRKMLLQGRIFVSARILGFYSNLFGRKTKFFFLWEEFYDVQVMPPSFASVGSPSLVIILHEGRGLDARRYAKCQDEEGRLRFQFQSFLSFSDASRTIKTLWRAKTFTPEQKVLLGNGEGEDDETCMEAKDDADFSGVKDMYMCKIHSASIPLNINSLMEMFNGGELEREIMTDAGCLNYTITPWEHVSFNAYERHISYKLMTHESGFGGSVTSIQRKQPIADVNGLVVNETATLHDVPFGDHFKVHLRYLIEESKCIPDVCYCSIFIGIAWLKGSSLEKAITRDIHQNVSHQMQKIFDLAEEKMLLKKSAYSS